MFADTLKRYRGVIAVGVAAILFAFLILLLGWLFSGNQLENRNSFPFVNPNNGGQSQDQESQNNQQPVPPPDQRQAPPTQNPPDKLPNFEKLPEQVSVQSSSGGLGGGKSTPQASILRPFVSLWGLLGNPYLMAGLISFFAALAGGAWLMHRKSRQS